MKQADVRTYGVCAINRSMYDVTCPSLWGLNCLNYATHVAPLGNIILIPSQPVFALSS